MIIISLLVVSTFLSWNLVTGATFLSQSMHDGSDDLELDEPYDVDDVPLGAATLAFVFDITGSMYDDLVQVIDGAAKILATTLARRDKPLYNYVLVPFHDPDVGPVTVTTDPDKFQRDLRDLYVQGGGDCPEMSITAIKLALQKSLPNSFVYVFTDARAKDYSLTEQVLTLIQQKQSQVVFVMTGDCGDTSHPGYRAYEQIASTSSGQIFLLKKSQVNQVLNFVRVAVQSRKVNLVSMDRLARDDILVYELPVDSKLQEFTISVSGERPNVVITDPQGKVLTTEFGLKTLLRLRNALILNIKDPSPGKWTLRVSAEGQHTIRVTGLSSLDFVHGFSLKPTLLMSETEARPIKGIPTHVLLNATDLDLPGRIYRMELVNLHGDVISEIPIRYYETRPSLFNISNFIAPAEFFYLKVVGVDGKGYEFQRTTPTAISPISPSAPIVVASKITRGFYEETVLLTCNVTSLTPFSVQWYRNGRELSNRLFYSESATASLSVPTASSFNEGHYTCNATNSAGWNSATTLLDVKDPPPSILKPEDVSAAPGTNAIFTCIAYSTVDFNLTWFRSDNRSSEYVELGPKAEVFSNGSMIIRSSMRSPGEMIIEVMKQGKHISMKKFVCKVDVAMELEIQGSKEFPIRQYKMFFNDSNVDKNDEGVYVCRASNEGGYNDGAVWLLVQKEPQVSVSPSRQTFVAGAIVHVACSAIAYPKPMFVWRRLGSDEQEDQSGEIDDVEERIADRVSFDVDGLLTIAEASREDAGEWECLATNALGSGVSIAALDYIELPTIYVPQRLVLVNNGDSAVLVCDADGIPKPNITWYRDGVELQELSFIQITPEGALTILGTQDVDAGEYECVATNEAGSTTEIVELDVGSAPIVLKTPQNKGVDILKNISLPCSAVGKPQPTITWSRSDGKPINFDNSHIQVMRDGTLSIYGIHKEEEGMYICTIHNQFGTHQLSAFVTVTGVVKPLIAYTSPSVEIIEDRDVKLMCIVLLGNPTPKITWYRMGEPVHVSGDGRIADDGNGNLVLNKVKVEDEGEYTCVASNAGGNATHIAKLDVQVPPLIRDTPGDIVVTQGRSIRLPCEVSGDPRPQITWTKNGVRLSEVDPHYFISESGSLEIFSADSQDTATYSCTAINVAGVKEKRIMLFVQIPPTMAMDHDEVTVIVNNPIQLSCEVTGIPPPEVKWRRGGEDLSFIENTDGFLVLPNGALRVNHVSVEDGGMYECIALSIAGNASKTIMLNVQVPPQLISRAPPSIIALVGTEVILPCEVTGDPRPKIEWGKDQSRIDLFSEEHKYMMRETGSLVIPNVDVRDAARYNCHAENPAGVVTQEINLIVHEPPYMSIGAQTNASIIENNRVILPCPARGTPLPKIRWLRNGIPVAGNEIGERVMPDGSLQLEHAHSNNTGRYTCIAENIAGNVTHSIELTVYVSPRFAGEEYTSIDGELAPETHRVIQYQTFYLRCPAYGVPPPEIAWFKDGEEFTEEILTDDERVRISQDGIELEVESAIIEDSARYTCLARNLAGETEKNFDVDVHIPPRLDESMISKLNLSVIIDNPVVIDCSADGIPPPEIVWFKDGREVSPDQIRDIRILPSGRRLEISSADLTDAGKYKCVAKNAAGKVERDFELYVWIPAKIESSEIISTPEVVVNQTVTLFCPASGVPDAEVTWYLEDGEDEPTLITNSSDTLVFDNGYRLRIERAQVSHTARYTCRAQNIAGLAEKYYDLSVLVVPVIDRLNVLLQRKVVINQTIAINCQVTGIPTPNIVWLRNGELLDVGIHPNIRILSDGRQLRMEKASVSDAATYRCLATNKAGQDNLDFQVSVHVPSNIDRSRVNVNPSVIVNQSRILDCPVIGVPTPVITWYKDGLQLTSADMARIRLRLEGRKLEFMSTNTVDAGVYECRAENEAGTDSIRFELKVFVPPQINLTTSTSSNPQVIISSSITIKCNVHGIPSPKIQWLFNNQALDARNRRYRLHDDGYQLEIAGAELSDGGRYTCIAKNEAGIVDRDFDLDVLVPPRIDSTNLEMKPKVIRGKSITLNCPAQGTPFPNITWLKDGNLLLESERIRYLLNGRQLEISLAQESDALDYTCLATNIAGKATKEFTLEVLVPPAIDEANLVDNPKIVVNRTVLLECPVSGTPPPKIKWLKNGESMKPGPDMKITSNGRNLEITRAHVTDTARYTCTATNEAGELRRSFDLEVLVPASILGQGTVEDVEVVENHTTYFACPAEGIPPPSILWLRNKSPLLDFPYPNLRELSNGRQLELRNVQVGDEGIFQCQATNVAGQKSKSFKLKVQVPPRIAGSRSETELSVVARRPVKMECEPSGVPEPTIIWLKDGNVVDIEQTKHIRVLRGGRILQIVSANIDDSGLYSCSAQNSAGHEQRRYRLNVHVTPTINNSQVIEELAVVIGSPAAMHCPAYGTPEPTVRWIREGMPITFLDHPNLRVQDGGQTLQIHNMQLMDVGGYTCVASNVAGNTTKEFLVNILVPPTIEDGLTEVAAAVDSRATLSCDTLGLPKPEVVWEKNGKSILPVGQRYMMSRTGSLQFTNIQVNDSGSYRCIARNDAGSVYRDIELSVQVPPKIEHQGLVHIKVTMGSPTELPCKASGIPRPRIVWQKGTRAVADESGYRLLDSGSLRIDSVDTKDAGIYVCVAQNSAGTAMSQVKLEVLVPPSIEQSQAEFRIVQDRDVTLPCRATSLPAPRIHWQKDGQSVSEDNFRIRKLRSGWLAISMVRIEDAGVYTCIAENDAGRATHDVHLIVHVPPSIGETERTLTVSQNEVAELPCHSEGFPPPKISWIREGRSHLETRGKYEIRQSGSLIITGVQASDAGSYVCTAKNSAGRDSKEVILRVQVPPSFTHIPRDLEVTANGRIELECIAEGVPTPSVNWRINNTDFHIVRQTLRKNRMYRVTTSMNGRSRLVINDAMKHDDGTYMCIAENPAGQRRALAAVRVKVPPKVLIQTGNQAVSISERVQLDCPVVGGDPPPMILWTKNDQPVEISGRIQQLANGSLAIYDSSNDDAGEYKCVATNDAGSSEGVAFLTVKVPPSFKVEPRSMVVDQGQTVMMNCVAEGEPEPQMTWRKGRVTLPTSDERLTILPNNSIRIIAAQLADSGNYICIARNSLESILIHAELTVQVHGQYSPWSRWSECSSTCGEGSSMRTRSCDNPEPANGGRQCNGPARETQFCSIQDCPVDGFWSPWSDWEQCSQSCGQGYKSRSRECNYPAPQNGGKICDGDNFETIQCNGRPCPVDGRWNEWSPWQQCSESCGDGVQERHRKCDSPRPEYGGRECVGSDIDHQPCHLSHCETNGNWGSWTAWSMCTLSCGGGTKSRKRDCDSPAPSSGGRFCSGSDIQVDYCNRDECPVHGNWAEWSSWGDCTVSCGGGQRRRFRTCSNPMPRHNGRPCVGLDHGTESCNSQSCAVDGEWGAWGDWSECSKQCGTGLQQRHRICQRPKFGGTSCAGDSSQMKKCNLNQCRGSLPHQALANVIGNVNNVEFGVAQIYANVSRRGSLTEVMAVVEDIPGSVGYHLQPLISLLTPIYWSTAVEVDEAVNGYTLTQGYFQREVEVEFATGETLRMVHSSRGVDGDGVLVIDVVMSGEIPALPEYAEISILPYNEDYIQTGPGSLYAHSARVFQMNGHAIPYGWNHSINYEHKYGRMPFLVERLTISDAEVSFDRATDKISYRVTASIAKGEPSNQCPTGFTLDSDGLYCKDDDECKQNGNLCSHSCVNTVGSFMCRCPDGHILDANGLKCSDVNECTTGMSNCQREEECINTVGSFHCVQACQDGFRRSESTKLCEDVNECQERTGLCDHSCINTVGSFMCSCRDGFQLVGQSKCGDVDECAKGANDCNQGQECRNSVGGYECVETCPQGFSKASDGTCVDIDECRTSNECRFNQVCINSPGGYSCTCPRGFRSAGPNSACVDLDECAEQPSPCSHVCRNTRGGYQCLCPPGQKLLADRKSCAGLQIIPDKPRMVAVSGDLVRTRCPLKALGRPCITNSTTSDGTNNNGTGSQPCPRGFSRKGGQCIDIDECQKLVRCQHGCQNTPGSFQCTCPPGYRLAANRRTCQDIDECAEGTVTCPANQQCFNKRGDYDCIDISCPAQYERDPRTGYCVLDCQKLGTSCPPGAPRFKQILEFHMVALPSGIVAQQDLIRLVAYDQENVHLPRTTFTILENDDRVPFAIRLEDGKGVVYTLRPLHDRQTYKIKVEAKSFDHRRRGVQYQTTFMIYISVSSFPY